MHFLLLGVPQPPNRHDLHGFGWVHIHRKDVRPLSVDVCVLLNLHDLPRNGAHRPAAIRAAGQGGFTTAKKSYSEEFKAGAVRMVIQERSTVSSVAKRLGG